MAVNKAVSIELGDEERSELEMRVRRRKSSHGAARRARIVLLAAAGESNLAISEKLGLTRKTVGTWRQRFAERGLAGLDDEPRPGAPRKIGDEKITEVVTRTLETVPEDATHWSRRSMARASGISATTVHRIWGAFGLQPYRVETFKLSSDPLFIDKVRDIVGLYLAPPERALVLCIDEKSQIQALDRTQPMLPMRPGQAERHTHDYKRHGTTTLFAALDVATGAVIAQCKKRHRAREFRAFLDEVERNVPAKLDIHVVMDNASSHKTKLICDWFRQASALASPLHPDLRPHGSTKVERFFALLTERQIKRGIHRSTADLEAAIGRYIETCNREPRPFRWTKSADDILASIERFCRRTLKTHRKTA